MNVVYCPECGDMFEYEFGTYLTAIPYLRFCSRKCQDTHMEDKIVVAGMAPKSRNNRKNDKIVAVSRFIDGRWVGVDPNDLREAGDIIYRREPPLKQPYSGEPEPYQKHKSHNLNTSRWDYCYDCGVSVAAEENEQSPASGIARGAVGTGGEAVD